MTRQLAQDAYRYVSRVYVNERQQCAYLIALRLHLRHGDDWCAAKIIDAIAAELPER